MSCSSNCNAVVVDTMTFFEKLLMRYNIGMMEVCSTPYQRVFHGAYYTAYGELYGIKVVVKAATTEVKVFRVLDGKNKICVFQKSYSTAHDKQSLSKSISLVKFLDKIGAERCKG